MSAHRTSQNGFPSPGDLGSSSHGTVGPAVTVRLYRSGRWVVIEVEGEMDIQVIPLVPVKFGDEESFVVFELHGVTFMDAAGFGVIAATYRNANEDGGCVRLAAPSRQARRLLELANSARTFTTFDALADAVSTPF
jgi:anti-sigma B factor antagonist